MRLEIKNDYPADWKDVSAGVKEAAGNRCIRCGHPAGDTMRRRTAFDEQVNHEDAAIVKTLMPCDTRCTHPRDGKMRALTVHHLDGDKANMRWWNLLALCQFCHLSVQARVGSSFSEK